MNELKPCPFCGGEAGLCIEHEKNHAPSLQHLVQCRRCFATTFNFDTEAEATEVWNTRHEMTCSLIENDADPYNFFIDMRKKWAEEEGVPVESVRIINYTCSKCGNLLDSEKDNYCRNCGAKVVKE